MFTSSKPGDLGLPSRRKISSSAAPPKKSKIPGPSTTESKFSLAGPSSRKFSNSSQSGGRASLQHPNSKRSSQSRLSIVGQTTKPKDPRPLSDKAYQQSCLKRLRTFLIEHNYPREVKPKCLQSPSTKEFIFILNFILEQLNPGLAISGLKIDEEIPYLLKFLKYPFNISRNHLLSVGSPHSWPIMLGLLTWLLDLCVQEDQTDTLMFSSGTDAVDFEADFHFVKTEFEMTNELYRLYLTHGPDHEEYLSLLAIKKDSQKNMYEKVQDSLMIAEKKHQELLSEHNELQQSSIETLQQKLADIRGEIDEQLKYLNEVLGPRIEATTNNTINTEQQTASLELQIEETKKSIGQVLEEIKTQPMSAKEAQNFHQKIKEKQDTVKTLKQRVEEAREGVFDLQRRHGKKVAEIVGECKEVNDSLRKLSTVVPEAECISILDYNTSKRADPSVLNQLVQQAKVIKANIHQLDEKIAKEIAEHDANMISLESSISSIQNELAMKEIECDNQEKEISKGKDQLQKLRQKRQNEKKVVLSLKLDHDSKIAELEEKLENNEMEQTLEETKARYDKEYKEAVESIREMTQSLQQLCFAILSHFERQKLKQKQFCAQYKTLVEMFNQMKPPAIQAKFLSPALLAKLQAKATTPPPSLPPESSPSPPPPTQTQPLSPPSTQS